MDSQLISHVLAPQSIEQCVEQTEQRLRQTFNNPQELQLRLDLLHQLIEFDFGRFFLQNQGINGFWSHYMITHPYFGKQTGLNHQGQPLALFEKILLERFPILLATQQRFDIFLRENQTQVKNGATLACIPAGMMYELFYLNFSDIDNINLIGIDYDADTFNDAKKLAIEKKLLAFSSFVVMNAWEMQQENAFDLISSNGLTIYEENDETVTEVFKLFHRALKPGGKLVTSFLTPPPTLTSECEWNMSKIDSADLLLQKMVVMDVVNAKFQCYRSSKQTLMQLEQAGFVDNRIIYDEAKLFPTVVGYKAG